MSWQPAKEPEVVPGQERIEQAKAGWQAGRFTPVPGETESIPLPRQ